MILLGSAEKMYNFLKGWKITFYFDGFLWVPFNVEQLGEKNNYILVFTFGFTLNKNKFKPLNNHKVNRIIIILIKKKNKDTSPLLLTIQYDYKIKFCIVIKKH